MFIAPNKDLEVPKNQLCYGCPYVAKSFAFYNAMIIELIGGFFVVYIYYSTVVDKRGNADFYPLMIGLVLFFLNLIFGIEMTVVINPSRFLATSIVNL